VYGAITLYGAASQPLPLTRRFVTSRPRCGAIADDPTTPSRQPPQGIAPRWFGLIPFRSPLLRESRFLFVPRATKMFQFAHLPPLHLWIQYRVPAHYRRWVSPFGHPRIDVCSATPRGFSQPSASFIGSRCQGIHRVLLFSYLVENTMNRYAVFKMRADRLSAERPRGARLPGRRNDPLRGRCGRGARAPVSQN
jgi:hypothetical protein